MPVIALVLAALSFQDHMSLIPDELALPGLWHSFASKDPKMDAWVRFKLGQFSFRYRDAKKSFDDTGIYWMISSSKGKRASQKYVFLSFDHPEKQGIYKRNSRRSYDMALLYKASQPPVLTKGLLTNRFEISFCPAGQEALAKKIDASPEKKQVEQLPSKGSGNRLGPS